MSSSINHGLFIEGIKNKQRMEGVYQDKFGNLTKKIFEPFVIGDDIKSGETYVGIYQNDGETTTGTYTFKSLFLESFLESIALIEQHFEPTDRKGFNPNNPISNVELVPESITIVDYDLNKDV